MSAFPFFSNVAPHVQTELNRRKGDMLYISRLNCWIRVSSGVGSGCMLYSNPNFPLFTAMGSTGISIYGNDVTSGTIGVAWDGKTAISARNEFWGFRPSPIVSSVQIDEGAGSLSRKAEFTITAFTKAQLNELCKYYLEPGYTIFLEFGWNTKEGVSQYIPSLDAVTVGKHQSFDITNRRRTAAKGHYDNYLGFITGGSISQNGDTWTINVKCTGFTELPAFLNVADSSEEVVKNTEPVGQYFKPTLVNAETDLGRKRFMMAFNRLPSNKQSQRIANLINDKTIANYKNFINVDEQVKENINDTTTGTSFLGFSINDEEIKTEGETAELPAGTRLIGDEAFIRFGTLMKIMNTMGADGFLVGTTVVKNYVNTENTVCSAFPRMFSTDKSKLLIPNNQMPFFSVLKAATGTTQQEDFSKSNPNNVEDIYFPSDKPLSAGKVGDKVVQFVGLDMFGISKGKWEWGLLDNLYVNMDFAKGILETKNFLVKDALYQILNGISSAAGGMWDFQIQESSTTNGVSTELTVVDMNFIQNGDKGMAVLDAYGVDSIFIDSNLDLDISGAKMNQVIAKRLNYTANSSSSPVDLDGKQGLFTDQKDMVLQAIRKGKGKTSPVQVKAPLPPAEPKVDLTTTLKEGATKLINETTADKPQDRNVVGNVAASSANVVTGTLNKAAGAILSFFGNDEDAAAYNAAAAEDFAEATESWDEAVTDTSRAVDSAIDKTAELAKEGADVLGITAVYELYKKWSNKEEAKEKNFQQFLDKLGAYPRVEVTATDSVAPPVEFETIAYLVCYNDQLAFESLKNGSDKLLKAKPITISALMPIKYSFTVHGVSGFKRGDKFKVRGIPTQYETGGFFQVTAVKQIIEGQLWKTEVEGQFRLAKAT